LIFSFALSNVYLDVDNDNCVPYPMSLQITPWMAAIHDATSKYNSYINTIACEIHFRTSLDQKNIMLSNSKIPSFAKTKNKAIWTKDRHSPISSSTTKSQTLMTATNSYSKIPPTFRPNHEIIYDMPQISNFLSSVFWSLQTKLLTPTTSIESSASFFNRINLKKQEKSIMNGAVSRRSSKRYEHPWDEISEWLSPILWRSGVSAEVGFVATLVSFQIFSKI
jgi:hypothetical protein